MVVSNTTEFQEKQTILVTGYFKPCHEDRPA